MNDELKLQLRRQLAFLTNSARLFDAGYEEEAIRIAVGIRVLMHDTNMSTSLLRHAGCKETTRLLSTAKHIDPAVMQGADYVMFFPTTFGPGIRPTNPHQLPTENKTSLLTPQWWNEPVLFHKQKTFSRREVVLVAANKDGGAHAEKTASSDLAILREGFWEKIITKPDGSKEVRALTDNHFPLLRHFAEELLQSPELLALAA